MQLRDAAILTTEPTEVTGGVSVERLACRFVLVLALVIVIVDSLIRQLVDAAFGDTPTLRADASRQPSASGLWRLRIWGAHNFVVVRILEIAPPKTLNRCF